jgi:hypothetical protein
MPQYIVAMRGPSGFTFKPDQPLRVQAVNQYLGETRNPVPFVVFRNLTRHEYSTHTRLPDIDSYWIHRPLVRIDSTT